MNPLPPMPQAPVLDAPVSSQLLFTVLEGVELGTWDWDLTTGQEYFSPRLKAIYGYNEMDDLTLASQMDELTHPDDRARMQFDRDAHWSGRQPYYRNEHRVRHRNGQWVWVLSKGLVVARDAQGKPLRMVGIHVDISDRKREELRHRETRERLELALNGANDGLWDWDLLTNKVYHSPRYMSLLGYASAREFEAEYSFRGSLHPEDLARVTRLVNANVEGHASVFDVQYRLRCRDGSYRWFHGRGAVARTADGKPLHFAGHLSDVTERMEAETARRELETRLRDAQKQDAIGALAAGVARDFGELVGTIQVHLEGLRAHWPADHPAQQGLREVMQAATRASQLAQAMLTLGRRQAQHMVLLDMGQLVSDVVSAARPGLPASTRLAFTLPATPACVLADAAQMRHVVSNLCVNASQAVAVQGGDVQMSVAHDLAHAGVLLTVRDSGVGMSPQVLARVFEPFFTAQPAGPGSGLGLPVVNSIVRSHQGRIQIESQPGQGTCVTVWLPAVVRSGAAGTPVNAPLAPQPAQPLNTRPAAPADGPVPAEGEPARQRPHVVYIDDYEAMVYLISRMLNKRGIRVSAFERAEDALALIQANPADVDMLVTDYNMPGLSGLDVVRQVKIFRPDLPAVVTSGHVTPGMTREAEAEGVLQVLNKHDSVDDLAQALATLLEKVRPRAT